MSTIYIQEPPTYGKVLLKTTVGDIDIELWSKEAPLASRNFIQLCMEKYYDNTMFHRVVKGFIVQGGDPSGSGSGGESAFGEPFKDEFHSRLRFNKRGLVAMANAGKNDNGSQFFFTLAPTPELQNKHTIFGKVGGNTIFNMLKLEEGLVVDEDRPMYPQKILSAEIILNPFLDIIPREDRMPAPVSAKKAKQMEVQGVKNFKLLSFGDEAEEDEEDLLQVHKNFVNKPKVLPGLVEPGSVEEPLPQPEAEPQENETPKLSGLDYVKSKLAKKPKNDKEPEENKEVKDGNDDSEDSGPKSKKKKTKEEEEVDEEEAKIKEEEAKEKEEEAKKIAEEKKLEEAEMKKKELLREEYMAMTNPYAHLKRGKAKAKTSEDITLKKLKEFQNKIRNKQNSENSDSTNKDDDWITHKLTAPERKEVLAKDANTMSDEWFDITDPRNSINKRKRKEI